MKPDFEKLLKMIKLNKKQKQVLVISTIVAYYILKAYVDQTPSQTDDDLLDNLANMVSSLVQRPNL